MVSLSLNRGRGFLKNLLDAPIIYNAKSVVLAVNTSSRWLNNVSGVYLVQVSLLLIVQQSLGHFKQQANSLLSMHNYTPLLIIKLILTRIY
jgi:hypothetical protein